MKKFSVGLLITVVISLLCVLGSCGNNENEITVIDSDPSNIGEVTFDTQAHEMDNDTSESQSQTADSGSHNENSEETIPYDSDKESGFEEIYPAD